MKRTIKLPSGVTLLEIMLVLAIASMVIVMSIRYYQSATNAQNANVVMQQIQNITAAADNLAQGGTYVAASNGAVSAVAGTSNMITPYKTTITISAESATGYTVTIPGLPAAVCQSTRAKLASNPRFTSVSACTGGATASLTYVYNSQVF